MVGLLRRAGRVVPQRVGQIPWGHNTITVDTIKAPDQALWCVRTTVENDSSCYELASTLPESLKASLPTIEEVEAELRKRPVSIVPDPYWLSVLRVVVLGLATEREKRIAAPDVEIKEVRRQAEAISAKNGRLEGVWIMLKSSWK